MAVHVLTEVEKLYGPASHLPSFGDKPKVPGPPPGGIISISNPLAPSPRELLTAEVQSTPSTAESG